MVTERQKRKILGQIGESRRQMRGELRDRGGTVGDRRKRQEKHR